MNINLKAGATNREDVLRFISSGLVEHREYLKQGQALLDKGDN